MEILGRAFVALPSTKARWVFGDAVELAEVCEPRGKRTGQMLDEVKRFHSRCLSGHYYQDFAVNSRNFTHTSAGTQEWIAEMNRLFSRCAEASKEGRHPESRAAFDLLFDLMSQVDECRDDIVFFADEGGSWQVGADLDALLPAYFASLAATTEPAEFAERSLALIRELGDYDRGKYLRLARLATEKEREAHSKALVALASQTYGGPAG